VIAKYMLGENLQYLIYCFVAACFLVLAKDRFFVWV